MVSIIAVIIVLSGLIFFHELGHFLVAKMLNIGVRVFSLGFGPKIFGFQFKGTEYRISLAPLGGYVHLIGEKPEEEVSLEEMPYSFSLRPPWQKMAVVIAGPLFNFVLAWIIFFVVALTIGQMALLPEVGDVLPNSPAQKAGLKKGDVIVQIDNKKVKYWTDLVEIIRNSKGKELTFVIKRKEELFEVKIRPKIERTKNIFGEEILTPRIGIVASQKVIHIKMGPLKAIWISLVQVWDLIKLTVEGIIKIIERIIPVETIGGPIMIVQLVSQQAKEGILNVAVLTAVISINLGLINLLPIPVLDGGHIMFYSLEMILRRPLSPKLRELSIKIGITILILLMTLAVYNDIFRIINKR